MEGETVTKNKTALCAVRIEVEYSDGTKGMAEGSDAKQIMNWWMSCETLAFIHGIKYSGPTLEEVK